jgi:hypothetical protein
VVSEPAAASGQSTEPTNSQQNALQALDGVKSDIDGMQAPPLDLGTGAPSATSPSNSNASTSTTNNSNGAKASAPPADDMGLALPPLQDSDVKAPKDLDLPPTDDLGNVNLDSRNK